MDDDDDDDDVTIARQLIPPHHPSTAITTTSTTTKTHEPFSTSRAFVSTFFLLLRCAGLLPIHPSILLVDGCVTDCETRRTAVGTCRLSYAIHTCLPKCKYRHYPSTQQCCFLSNHNNSLKRVDSRGNKPYEQREPQYCTPPHVFGCFKDDEFYETNQIRALIIHTTLQRRQDVRRRHGMNQVASDRIAICCYI